MIQQVIEIEDSVNERQIKRDEYWISLADKEKRTNWIECQNGCVSKKGKAFSVLSVGGTFFF